MLPINYRSYQDSFSELPNSCQQLELTLLSTIAVGTIKILSTVGGHNSVDRSLQSYQNPIRFRSSCIFYSYVRPGRHYASRQLSEFTTVAFRAAKIRSTKGVDIPVDYSFQSYQNLVNNGAEIPVDHTFKT